MPHRNNSSDSDCCQMQEFSTRYLPFVLISITCHSCFPLSQAFSLRGCSKTTWLVILRPSPLTQYAVWRLIGTFCCIIPLEVHYPSLPLHIPLTGASRGSLSTSPMRAQCRTTASERQQPAKSRWRARCLLLQSLPPKRSCASANAFKHTPPWALWLFDVHIL